MQFDPGAAPNRDAVGDDIASHVVATVSQDRTEESTHSDLTTIVSTTFIISPPTPTAAVAS